MGGRVAFLLALGLLGLLAEATSLPTLRRLASATTASPVGAPRPPHRATIEWGGPPPDASFAVTTEGLARISGPPALRRVYEQVLTAAPEMEAETSRAPMLHAVLPRLLCGPAPGLLEIGASPSARTARRVRYAGPGAEGHTIETRCR